MQQAGNENTQAYQVEVVISILLQILVNCEECEAARRENKQSDLGS